MSFSKIFAFTLLFLLVLLSISSASILVLLSEAPSYVCAFWRLFLSTMMILSYVFIFEKKTLVFDKKVLFLSLLSGLALGLHFLLWMESLFHIPVAISTTIVVSYPLFSLFIDKFFYKERITFIQIIGFIGGFAGIIAFLHPNLYSDYNVYGVLLALGGALAATVYFSIGRYIRSKIHTRLIMYVLPTYGFASLTTLIYTIFIGGDLLNYSLKSYICFVLLALIPMIGGHTTMNFLLKYMKTSVVTAIALGEPIGASLLAYLFLGQIVTLKEALLIALVLSSLFLIVYGEIKKPNQFSAISS